LKMSARGARQAAYALSLIGIAQDAGVASAQLMDRRQASESRRIVSASSGTNRKNTPMTDSRAKQMPARGPVNPEPLPQASSSIMLAVLLHSHYAVLAVRFAGLSPRPFAGSLQQRRIFLLQTLDLFNGFAKNSITSSRAGDNLMFYAYTGSRLRDLAPDLPSSSSNASRRCLGRNTRCRHRYAGCQCVDASWRCTSRIGFHGNHS